MNGLRSTIGTYGVHELKLYPFLNTPLILGIERDPQLDPRWVKKAINMRFYPNKIAMKSDELN